MTRPLVVPVTNGRKRRCLFRAAAVCLGLLPFAAIEALCWCCGWGEEDVHDPYIAISTVRPLFVPSADRQRFEIPHYRRGYFGAESFPIEKRSGTIRLFVVGESTVAGEPFGKSTSFTTWLQLALQAGDRSHLWEVVNCGGISYASYRLAPIVEECLSYEPDLIVLTVGHNEFLEDRTYAPIRALPAPVSWLNACAGRTRSMQLIHQWIEKPAAAEGKPLPPTLPGEVSARLDFAGGLDEYHRDDVWQAGVVAHYEFNLRRMLDRARSAGVPIILIRQPSNLADCTPFKSEHDPALSDADRQRFDALINEAHLRLADDLPVAIARLEQAIAIDPTFARTHYELGKCYETSDRLDDARAAYVKARDFDVCPLRMVSSMERILESVAHETETPLVDAHTLFESRTCSRILGNYWLVDHVHPSVAGHQLLARRLAEELQALEMLHPGPDWDADCESSFRAHAAGLDATYYLHGQQTLIGLRGWAAGRAEVPRPKKGGRNRWRR